MSRNSVLSRGWRVTIATLGAWLGSHLTVAAESAISDFPPSAEKTRAELSAVVHAQLDSIKAKDWARAYALAAAGIQEKFDPAAFEAMIRSSYPDLLRPRIATTLRANDNGAQAVLEIRIVSEEGVLGHYRYFLELDVDAWRIVGVVPFEPPAVRD